MTRAEQDRFKRALEAFVRNATGSEAAAQKALQKTGIFTKSGRVSKHYGGPLGHATGKIVEPDPVSGSGKAKKSARIEDKTAA